MDCSPPGSSVHGISQARILEWVAMSYSRESSWPRDQTQISCIVGRFFTIWATREAKAERIRLLFTRRNHLRSLTLLFSHLWKTLLWVCFSSSSISSAAISESFLRGNASSFCPLGILSSIKVCAPHCAGIRILKWWEVTCSLHSPPAHFCDQGKDGAAGIGAAFHEQTWVLLWNSWREGPAWSPKPQGGQGQSSQCCQEL